MAAALAWAAVETIARAGERGDVLRLGDEVIARRREVEGVTLSLQGAGFLRVGLVFKVYGAALFLQRPGDALHVLDDVPKSLDIYYLHNTPRQAMIDAAEKALARNLTPDRLNAVRADIDRLHAVYADRKPGDVGTLTYVPGRGTVFSVNGNPVVRIADPDFAAAYFRVWLGDAPSSDTMRRHLLTPYAPDGE